MSEPKECSFICNAKADIERLEAQLSDNHRDTKISLDKLTESILGNGKIGLTARVSSLESWTGTVKRLLWIILTTIIVSGVGLTFAYHDSNKSITEQEK